MENDLGWMVKIVQEIEIKTLIKIIACQSMGWNISEISGISKSILVSF